MVDASSFNQFGTTSFVSGLSGTNFSSIVKAEYQKDISGASLNQKHVNNQKQKLARFEQLAELVKDFQNVSKNLSEKTFSSRTVTQPNGSEKNIKITLSDKAQLGRMSLKIMQLASAHKISSQKFSSSTTALSNAGVLHLKTGDKIGADISISNSMSLGDVAKEINSKAANTGVIATIVKISNTEHRLILSSAKTNQPIKISDKNAGSLTRTLGLLDGSGKIISELSQAKPAKIEFNGLMVERNDNKFSDVLPGVNMTLLKVNPSLSMNIDIESNRAGIKEEIKKFVATFNKLRSFVVSQQATSSGGGAAPGAHLFGESILKNLMDSIYNELGGSIKANGIQYSMRSFGLAFNNDNTLKLDVSKLDKAIDDNLDGTKLFFAGNSSIKGIGDRLISALSPWNGSETSIIDKERSNINSQISSYQGDIKKVVNYAKNRRENLIRYYAQLERQIASAKLMMRQLDAITKANSSQS